MVGLEQWQLDRKRTKKRQQKKRARERRRRNERRLQRLRDAETAETLERLGMAHKIDPPDRISQAASKIREIASQKGRPGKSRIKRRVKGKQKKTTGRPFRHVPEWVKELPPEERAKFDEWSRSFKEDPITRRDHKWSVAVRDAAGWTCDVCDSKYRTEAHHLESKDEHPRLRHIVNNGVCLCHECHAAFHQEYGFKDNTRLQYEIFKEDMERLISGIG